MKIRRIDRKTEKSILIGLITDRAYLARIRTKYKTEYLKNNYAKTIAKWCLEYFDKYDEAPENKIQDIYEYHDKREGIKDGEVDLIEKLLEQISDEYSTKDNFNSSYLLDKTEEYFNRVRIENIIARTNEELEAGTILKAQNILSDSSSIKLSGHSAIDPLGDDEVLRSAFEEAEQPLLKLHGAIGELMNELLTRASFVVIQAPEKSGKTWLLYWFAIQALKNRLKVVIFQVGDMTEKQSTVRLAIALAKKSNKEKYCIPFKRPIKFIKVGQSAHTQCAAAPEGFDVDIELAGKTTPLTWEEAKKINDKFYKRYRIKKDKYLRVVCEPANSMSISDIDARLEELETQEGFVADVVIVDYMDILDAENPYDQGRDKINNNWITAKALCNKRNLLFLSGTQSDSSSYTGEIQNRNNFTEDKRKFSHVNGMLGMNQTDEEKKNGIMKLNWVVSREGEFISSRACYVLQCLRKGQPVVDSIFPEYEFKRKEEKNDKKKPEEYRKERRKERKRR